LIEELTSDHQPQVWYFENLQGESGFPYGCTMPPVSDPENWNWTTWSLAGAMIGFAMHNAPYRITVQWRYSVYMKGPRGPFQTSITINVQNLVVTSGDERKLLKWDPERPEICDTTFSYNIECAQKKMVSVTISIYSTEGMKVYEVTEQKICPGNYSFTWDGTVNIIPPPMSPTPDGKAKAGLYSFDVQVIGPAYYYDADWLRSKALRVGEHKIKFITARVIEGWYVLYSNKDAYEAWMEVYDPDLEKVTEATGTVHAIPENTNPTEQDWNKTVRVWVGFDKVGTWRFVFWARDNFLEFDKAHRRKLTLAFNQRSVDWILSGGFNYGDINTTRTAEIVIEILREVGYEGHRMEESTERVIEQIADFTCNNDRTKNAKGLIAFVGHGGGHMEPRWHQVGLVGHWVRYLHCPWIDCLRFPSGPPLLGANPVGVWNCPIGFPQCPESELDIGTIKEYVKDEERKETPLTNVLVVVLTACFSFTDVNGDFANKLINLGAQGVLGVKVAIGGWPKRTVGPGEDPFIAIKIWDRLHEFIWKHLSHGATLRSAAKKAYDEFINEAAKYQLNYELGILYFRQNCGPTSKGRLYLYYDKSLRKFLLKNYDGYIVEWNYILKIGGNENIRIVNPEDERVKSLRGKCDCVTTQ